MTGNWKRAPCRIAEPVQYESPYEVLPRGCFRIGSEIVDVNGMDYDEELPAFTSAVERAVGRGELRGAMQMCDRVISGVEMLAYTQWRHSSQSSLVDQFILRLLDWIGIDYE